MKFVVMRKRKARKPMDRGFDAEAFSFGLRLCVASRGMLYRDAAREIGIPNTTLLRMVHAQGQPRADAFLRAWWWITENLPKPDAQTTKG